VMFEHPCGASLWNARPFTINEVVEFELAHNGLHYTIYLQ
jgi:hypothetical protein